MNKYEFRVVWKRRGMERKTKRYATLKAAENRVLFMGPEPWLALKVDPDALQCCPGGSEYECGCGGATWREHLLSTRNEPRFGPDDPGMPPIEYIHIERRELSPWEALALPEGCHRSHPHEEMNAECERLTEVARSGVTRSCSGG